MRTQSTALENVDLIEWPANIKDAKAKARIIARLRSASLGNLGDCEAVGDGVSEMRIHVGPGYRVYFMRRDAVVHLLLMGGDKSTQIRDITRAKEMARAIREKEP
jgi:putative addiction module killer protein